MDLRSQFVPLEWYNLGYVGSIHSALDLRSPVCAQTPPPPYVEKEEIPELDGQVHPAFRYHPEEKQIIYATVRPRLSTLSTIASVPSTSSSPSPASPTTPTTPTSPRHSLSSHGRTPSLISDSSSISEWSSSNSSSPSLGSPKTLRRARKRVRALSLRELRQKQSEADLQKAYAVNVEEYLTGDIFDNFRVWPEPVIEEESR